jgi:hypothetical protein
MNDMNIYQCEDFIRQIEATVDPETGELSEEQFQALVMAHTTSLAKLGKVIDFLAYCDRYIETGQKEIERIHKLMAQAKKRRDSCKEWITPYVDDQKQKIGRPLDVGTRRVSTRHTKSVVITDPETFAAGGFPNESRVKTTYEPDKEKIKKFIEDKKKKKEEGGHPGAEIRENVSLIIK